MEGFSPTVGFPNAAFNLHNNATMMTVPDDPNRFIGALDNHGGNLLPILTSGTANTKDANVPFVTWVPPCCVHLFLSCRVAPCAAVVGSTCGKQRDSCPSSSVC